MIRLFGFIADKNISLEEPVNFIGQEILTTYNTVKKYYPAGWGFGFYQSNTAFLLKKKKEPVTDEILENLSNSVSSNVFMAHMIPSDVEISKEVDCQPFRKGSWLFLHSGILGCTKRTKSRIKKNISHSLINSISGSTGSEFIFHLFLSQLRGKGGIRKGTISFTDCIEAIKLTLQKLEDIHEEIKCTETNILNFLISNGSYLLAYREGTPLYFTKYNVTKNLPAKTDYNIGIITTEKYEKISGWEEIPEKSIIVFDEGIESHLFENIKDNF